MTVMASDNYKKFSGSGSPGPFTWPWRFLKNSDIRVYLISGGVRTLLSEGDDYALTGAGSYSGGALTLTFDLGIGEELVVQRYTEALQPVSIRNQGNNFRPEVHEDVFDKLTMIQQDRAVMTERSLLVPEDEVAEIIDPVEYDNRASKVLGWNSNGKLSLMPVDFRTSAGTIGNPWADAREYDSLADAVAQIGGLSTELLLYGNIAVADNLTIPKNILPVAKDGATLTIAAGKTLTFSGRLKASDAQIFAGSGAVVGLASANPLWFGAVGDGETDDTAAFNKAQAAADFVVITKPPVAYLVNGLVPVSGKSFYGLGHYPTIRTPDRVFYLINQNDKVTIEGLTIQAVTPGEGNGVEIGGSPGCTNIKVSDCRFANLEYGIFVSGAPGNPSLQCEFSNNLFEDCTIGVSVLGFSRSIVTHNTMRDKTVKMLRGIAVLQSTTTEYSHNKIIGNNTITTTGIFLFTSATNGAFPITDNTISNNYITGIKEEGLSLDTTTDAFRFGGTATSGTINTVTLTGAGWTDNAYGGYYAIIVDGTGKGGFRQITSNNNDTLTVQNYFQVAPDATSKFVIMAPPMRNRIINNTVTNTLREGIYIWSSGIGNIISGNTVTGCGSGTIPAVSLLGIGYSGAVERGPVFHNVVTGNTITNNDFAGIRVGIFSDVLHASTHQLQGNIVTNNVVTGYGVGVLVEYSEDTLVSDNILAGSSTGVKLTASTRNNNNTVVNNKTVACFKNYDITQTGGIVEFEGEAMPSTGTYAIGTRVKNTNPVLTGSGGYATANQKYTISGWRRITTGSNNVLNTDWVEERALTGM